jgi:hypothetical protein
MSDQLNAAAYFSSGVYSIALPQYLNAAREVSAGALNATRPPKANKTYPTVMSGNYANDTRLQEFTQYVGQTAWNILNAQGYAMDDLLTLPFEMWTQEHLHGGSMDTHVHGQNSQISAFYVLDAPSTGCRLVVHDPRPGKMASELPQAQLLKLTDATGLVELPLAAGMLVLMNSWLPHSLTRNASKHPSRLVHINIAVMPAGLMRQKEPCAIKTEVV